MEYSSNTKRVLQNSVVYCYLLLLAITLGVSRFHYSVVGTTGSLLGYLIAAFAAATAFILFSAKCRFTTKFAIFSLPFLMLGSVSDIDLVFGLIALGSAFVALIRWKPRWYIAIPVGLPMFLFGTIMGLFLTADLIVNHLFGPMGVNKDFTKVKSPDGRYAVIGTEHDAGATGGSITISVVGNPNRSLRYERTLYEGGWGERPNIYWIDNSTVEINGRRENIFSASPLDGGDVAEEKKVFAQRYLEELFEVDKTLYDKYKYETGDITYQGSNQQPTSFVDQAYFYENSRLKKFLIDQRADDHANGVYRENYQIPIGMNAENPKTGHLGKVVDIKRVEKIDVTDAREESGGECFFDARISCIALLDNGEEMRFRCFFTGYVVSGPWGYKIEKALFDVSYGPDRPSWTGY